MVGHDGMNTWPELQPWSWKQGLGAYAQRRGPLSARARSTCASRSLTFLATYQRKHIQLAPACGANPHKDMRVSLLHLVARRETAAHLLVYPPPSQAHLGEFIDASWDEAHMKDWAAAAAKIRIVVEAGICHDSSK